MKATCRTLKAALGVISILVVLTGTGKAWAGPERISGIVPVSEESGSTAYGEAEALEKELQGLIGELKALGRDIQETFRKDVLPRVREEIRKLRERLRELEQEEEQEPEDARRI